MNRTAAYATLVGLVALGGCGKAMPPGNADLSDPPAADMAMQQPEPDLAKPMEAMERRLDVKLTLAGTKLTVSVRDGAQPVMTDLWLYTVENGQQRPFGGFADPDSKRKSRRRMMPCTVGGQPSGLGPCNEAEENGVMTDAVREKITDGKRGSAIDGDVELTLMAAPTQTLLVVAGLEDQRYAGAAAIDKDGKAAPVPAGVGVPGRVERPRTYTKDVEPWLKTRCVGCHQTGKSAGFFRLTSYEDIVERDFGYEEAKEACAAMFPMDMTKRKECEDKITQVEFMIEKGAPALSPFLRRTRPDEDKAASAEGLKWYGSGGKRYGDHGDRRMPPENITADPMDDKNGASRMDQSPADYQILFDWVAQGAPR